MRAEWLIAAVVGGVALVAVEPHDANACGGCFHAPTSQNATVVTDHRMIFSISPTQTTLYDQIEYSGSPSDFAWVLPIQGQVGVGVSSDLLFSVLDRATQTTILAPPYPCSPCTCAQRGGAGGAGPQASADAGAAADGGVTVISQAVVGPYETVQLHPNSTSDTAALTSWLQANGYAIPASIDSVIAAYVQESFDFLAIKLVPNAGVRSMRPISVTTTGAGLSLPLRMVAAGTGATVGITLWVVSSGRYEPQNFLSFTIDPKSLVWDWSASMSNYTTLRTQKEQTYGNAAFQIESSLDLTPYSIESPVLQDPTASAYQAVPGPDGGVGQTALEARSQDLNTLFPMGGSMVRVTRMRGDLSQAALATDLELQASTDQSTLSNIYQTTLSVNASCPVCPCSSSGGSSSSGGFGQGTTDAGTGVGGSGSGSSGGTGTGVSNGGTGTGMSSGGAGTGSSGGLPGTGSNGGSGGMGASNGASSDSASGVQGSSGCALASGDAPGGGLLAGLGLFAGFAFSRRRARKAR